MKFKNHYSISVLFVKELLVSGLVTMRSRDVYCKIFSGLWLVPLALLVYRSRFLPRFLGVWLALARFAWVILSLTGVLSLEYL